MSTLIIDNFSKLDVPRVNEPLAQSQLLDYNLALNFTPQSYANVDLVNDNPALRVRGTGNANWALTYGLPNENSRYVLGLRYLNFSGTAGTAQLAVVANVTDTGYDVVLALQLTPSSLVVHYKDSTWAMAEVIPISLGTDAYLDISIDKVSTTANEMSQCVISINNFPVYVEKAFNNVGTDLAFAIAGVIPVTPDPKLEGYLLHVDNTVLGNADSNFYITDMYVTKDGLRYGIPKVHSTPVQDFNSMLTAHGKETVLDVVNSVPSDWVYAQGTGLAQGTFAEPKSAEVAQVTARLQSNHGDVNLKLDTGNKSQGFTVGERVTQCRTLTTAATPTVVLEIGNE